MSGRVRVLVPIDGRRLWAWWFMLGVAGGVVGPIVSRALFEAFALASTPFAVPGVRLVSGVGALAAFVGSAAVLGCTVGGLIIAPLCRRVTFRRGGAVLPVIVGVGLLVGYAAYALLMTEAGVVGVATGSLWSAPGAGIMLGIALVWLVHVLVLAVAGGMLLARVTGGRSVPQTGSLCWTCAYELAGLPTGGSCPECGRSCGSAPRFAWWMRVLAVQPPKRSIVLWVFVVAACVWATVVLMTRVRPLVELWTGAGQGQALKSQFGMEAAVWIPDPERPGRRFRIEYRPWSVMWSLGWIVPSGTGVTVAGATDYSGYLFNSGTVRVTASVADPSLQRRLRREGPPPALLAELRRRADAAGWLVGLPPGAAAVPTPGPSDFFEGDAFFAKPAAGPAADRPAQSP